MKEFYNKIQNTTGAVALVLVVMITSLTLVSAIAMALINISDMTANYHIGESEKVQSNIDSCVNEALYRIASSSAITGSYTLAASTTACAFQISLASAGIKMVTSTATTTSDFGSWNRGVILEVNVSTSPVFIKSYKDIIN